MAELLHPTPPPEPEDEEPPAVDPELVRLITQLGSQLVDSGEATSDVETVLQDVAGVFGAPDISCLVLPTGILVQVEGPHGPTTQISRAGREPLRLDQIGAVDRLVKTLLQGRTTLAEARRRLDEIEAAPPRFGTVTTVLGHTILSLGFGVVLNPSQAALPAYIGLGALVGLLRATAERATTLRTALPVLCSFVVTILSIEVLAPAVGDDPVRIAAPALVSFLPGAALTTATIELTHGQVVSGASRLVYGLSQLLLLTFGVVAAYAVTSAEAVEAPGTQLGAWSPWLGIALVAVGDVLFASAPKGSVWWIALALYAAFAAQAVGSAVLTPQLSGFVGGLAIVPVARLIARAPGGPPPMVTTRPAFWLLVPGALGFIGVSEVATMSQTGIDDLVNMGLALFAIALGVLTGTGLTQEARSIQRSIKAIGR